MRAFSLIELSIVLVILGLLTGGILAGQSLIRAAELRSITSDYQRIITATRHFQERYLGLPGDIPNASLFWGAADGAGNGNSAACRHTVGTGTTTCNGNGDDEIYPVAHSNEAFRFWQHLANAGLIEGNYSGSGKEDTNAFSATRENSLKGRVGESSLWMIWSYVAANYTSYMFHGQYSNTLIFGGYHTANVPATPIMTPGEVWNIDIKLDDGKPATGTVGVRVPPHQFSPCTNAADGYDMTADYGLTYHQKACVLIFRRVF